MKKGLLVVLISLLLSTMVFYSSSVATSEETIILKLGYGGATTHPYSLGYVKFKDLMEERTNGRVKIELYPGGQLGGDKIVTESVQMGIVDMALGAGFVLGDYDSRWNLTSLPFLFLDDDEVEKWISWEKEKGDLFGEVPGSNIIALDWVENGFRYVTNNIRPIKKPSDFKGIKIRTMQIPMHVELFKIFGASPTAIAFEEIYSAIQTKTVDGQENPAANIYAMGFQKIQKYLSTTGHAYTGGPTIINKGVYDALPDDIKVILNKSIKEASIYERELVRKENADKLKLLAEDLEVTYLTKEEKELFVKAALPVIREYAKEVGIDYVNEVLTLFGRDTI
jgi:tripartite ATP-independent transporter DctP family solute receptor